MNINEFLKKYGYATASIMVKNAANAGESVIFNQDEATNLREMARDLESALESYQKRMAELTKV